MFDAQLVNIAALPSVAIESRRELPTCQGIYFAVAPHAVLYIGKAKNIGHRWAYHTRLPDLEQWSGVRVSWLRFDGDAVLLDEIERACILYFKPLLNERSIKPHSAPIDCPLRLKVREVAESKGITDPVALAAKAKIAYATAYRLMRDEIGDEKRGVGILVLYKVARALDVPLMDLLEETGPMELAQLAA